MSKKKYLKGRLMLMLRRWGMLCKKSQPKAKRLHISRTLLADGTYIEHTHAPLKEELPKNERSIESEVHAWVEWKKGYNASCKFNTDTMSCVCGKTIEQFAKTKTCTI